MSVIKTSLPLADEDMSWDAGEAIKAVKDWASDDDGNIDFSKYKKAFFFVDDDNDGDDDGGKKQGDYKLPFATVVDGSLKAVWKGVAAAMAAINGARGGVDLGDDNSEKEAIYKQIVSYYKKFDKEPPAFEKALKKGQRVDFALSIEEGSVKALGDGEFECVVTTSSVDRMGEVIETGGISTDAYMANPVVLFGHDYSALPIGKTTKLTAYKNKMVARFQLAIKEYDFAATVAKLIEGGYLKAVSIGGVVKEMSEDWLTIKAMEMVEFSVVPVPANGEALITGKSLEQVVGKPAEQVAKEYHDFQQKAYAKTLKGLDSDDLDRHIKSLEEVTAILKSVKTDHKTSEAPTKIIIRRAASKASYHSQEIIRITRRKENE